jgi:hypothetical protein
MNVRFVKRKQGSIVDDDSSTGVIVKGLGFSA